MKYILLLMIVAFASCKKCYTCTSTTTSSPFGSTHKETTEYFGDGVETYERNNTITATDSSGAYVKTVVRKMSCREK
jgi:hypothetical protein